MSDLARLIGTLGQLKRTKRQGWLDRGVPSGAVESVADHSFMTALIAWFAAAEDPTLDRDKVLKLALIHDLAEALVGDAPPYEVHEVPPREDIEALRAFFSVRHLRTPENAAAKREAEEAAFANLVRDLPDAVRDEIEGLWRDYEEQETAESRFVKQVDRLEAYLQSRVYAETDPDLPLWGFTDMAEKEVFHPSLTVLRDQAKTGES